MFFNWQIIATILMIIGIIIVFVTYKSSNKILIGAFVLLLFSNYFLLTKYGHIQSNHNVAVWKSFSLTRKLMKNVRNIDEIDNKEDIEEFHKNIENINMSLNVLTVCLNNSDFISESIDKKDFYQLIQRIDSILYSLRDIKDIDLNDQIRVEIIELSQLLRRVEGGHWNRGILGIQKTTMIFEDDLYEQLKSKLEVIEKMLIL